MTLLAVPIKSNTLKGEPLRQYKKTITLSPMQREAGFARALFIGRPPTLVGVSHGRPSPLVGVALRAPSGLLGDASIHLKRGRI